MDFAPKLPEIMAVDEDEVVVKSKSDIAPEALAVASAYAKGESMKATKELLSDKDKITLMEVVSNNPDKFAQDDPAWLIIHAITSLKSVENDLLDATAEAAAKEVMQAKVRVAEIETEVEQYTAEAKKYVQKMISQHLNAAVKKTTDAINKNVDLIEVKMTKAMTSALIETAKAEAKLKYDVNRHQRWAAIAGIACLLLVGVGYMAGSESYRYDDYKLAKSDQLKWANLVVSWKNATKKEKTSFESMMSRSK